MNVEEKEQAVQLINVLTLVFVKKQAQESAAAKTPRTMYCASCGAPSFVGLEAIRCPYCNGVMSLT